jgi:hypothetical protein
MTLYQLYYTLSPGNMQPTGPYYTLWAVRLWRRRPWLPAHLGPFELRKVKVG